MGLDQWILRTSTWDDEPVILDSGEFSCREVLQLRKECWLHNRVLEIGKSKMGEDYGDLNCVFVPLSKDELEDILDDSKECVRVKSEFLVDEKFGTGLFYSNWDFDWCLDGMRIFNRTMGSALRSRDECYWYFAWW